MIVYSVKSLQSFEMARIIHEKIRNHLVRIITTPPAYMSSQTGSVNLNIIYFVRTAVPAAR